MPDAKIIIELTHKKNFDLSKIRKIIEDVLNQYEYISDYSIYEE